MSEPSRVVHHADALEFLAAQALPADAAVVTSLPDVSEFRHHDLERWRSWFVDAAALLLRRTSPRQAVVFFQTDVKRDGVWIDKHTLLQDAARAVGAALLWHKIVCRAAPGTTTFARPGYAHLVCFSVALRDDAERATADVLPALGAMTWQRAMGAAAARFAVAWLATHAGARTIVDPFCGVGTVLAAANERGLAAVGVERHAGRAQRGRTLTLPPAPRAG